MELFPDLRPEVEAHDATIYSVFFELLPRCQEAHDRGDLEELAKIYGFAEWRFRQKAKDLWNAAAVAFYKLASLARLAAERLSVRPLSAFRLIRLR